MTKTQTESVLVNSVKGTHAQTTHSTSKSLILQQNNSNGDRNGTGGGSILLQPGGTDGSTSFNGFAHLKGSLPSQKTSICDERGLDDRQTIKSRSKSSHHRKSMGTETDWFGQ